MATLLDALVAVDHPLPVDLVAGLDLDVDDDLGTELSRLELAGLVVWDDDGTVQATDDGRAACTATRAERARLRGLVGAAARDSSVPAELVAEWLLDGCRVVPDPAVVPWLLDRADRAVRAGDLRTAAAVLDRVVAVVERGHPVDPLDRVRAYVRLGYVLRWLGRRDDAVALNARAVDLARSAGDPAALAAAALAWRPDGIAVSDDPTRVALVDEALATLGDAEPALRARLLAARGEALLFTDVDAAQRATTEALALGRAVAADDAETFIAAAYAHRLAHWHTSAPEEVLRLGAEMVAAAPRAVDYAEFGAVTRLQAFLELGDWAHFDGELAAMARRLEHAPRPLEVLWLQVLDAARAQTRGEWARADGLITSALELASGPEYGAAFQLLLSQQVLAAWQRGDDLTGLVGASDLPAGPMRTGWEAGLLGWTCDQRLADDVHGALDAFLADGPASLRRDLTFGPVSSALAMAVAEVGATRHAAALLDTLAPYADRWATTGGAVVNGPFALHLGRLAGVLGRADDARDLLDRAWASAEAGECTPWLARIALARAHLAAAGDEARERRAQATKALDLAESVAMRRVADAARVLLGERTLPAGLTSREAEVLTLVAQGATNVELAERLCLSVKTVERHLLNAYRKAGVRNRAEAAAFALRELSH